LAAVGIRAPGHSPWVLRTCAAANWLQILNLRLSPAAVQRPAQLVRGNENQIKMKI